MYKIKLKRMVSTSRSFIADQQGVTAIEYAMIGVFVSAMVLAVFGTDNTIKQALISALDSVANNIAAAG
ncbi:Flp family type IVb pilin [Vibrio owensii]|uniref:Flp family type IVb pilin n=1 Tax=Vibrio owensii TaxID=696485 RepID=UPI003AACA2C3